MLRVKHINVKIVYCVYILHRLNISYNALVWWSDEVMKWWSDELVNWWSDELWYICIYNVIDMYDIYNIYVYIYNILDSYIPVQFMPYTYLVNML